MTWTIIQIAPTSIITKPAPAANTSASAANTLPTTTAGLPPLMAAAITLPTPRNQANAASPAPMQKHRIALLERCSGLGPSGGLIEHDPLSVGRAAREAAADEAIQVRDGFPGGHADEVGADLARKQRPEQVHRALGPLF